MRFTRTLVLGCLLLFLGLLLGLPVGTATARAQTMEPPTITPAALAQMLTLPVNQRPLIIQVGFHVMYQQAHIPGAEYIGPATDASAIAQLKTRLATTKRDALVVLYCGCCPWERCPNVRPAAALLTSMGFTNFKVVHIATNFGQDWVKAGFPTQKDQ